jgi:hypothetical protein
MFEDANDEVDRAIEDYNRQSEEAVKRGIYTELSVAFDEFPLGELDGMGDPVYSGIVKDENHSEVRWSLEFYDAKNVSKVVKIHVATGKIPL